MSGRAWLSTCTVLATAAVGLLGLEALVGWTFNLEICKSLWPAAVAMNPATAILFVLAALSLLLQGPAIGASLRVSAARLLAAIVLAAGVLRLCEYGFGFDLGFDTWLFHDRLENNVIAPNTALNFALLGVALLFLKSAEVRFRRLAQLVALVAALIT